MSKAVMISIRPRFVGDIFNFRKSLEIRKTKPNIETPFKCYIYCTKNGGPIWRIHKDVEELFPDEAINFLHLSDEEKRKYADIGNGMVMGEFTCDSIQRISVPYPAYQGELDQKILEESCLTYDELHKYAGDKDVYGWHISDPKVYDKPKPLSKIYLPCESRNGIECYYLGERCCYLTDCYNPDGTRNASFCGYRMHRPPQSWCYVGELQ